MCVCVCVCVCLCVSVCFKERGGSERDEEWRRWGRMLLGSGIRVLFLKQVCVCECVCVCVCVCVTGGGWARDPGVFPLEFRSLSDTSVGGLCACIQNMITTTTSGGELKNEKKPSPS